MYICVYDAAEFRSAVKAALRFGIWLRHTCLRIGLMLAYSKGFQLYLKYNATLFQSLPDPFPW